jgi:hypothetical protein
MYPMRGIGVHEEMGRFPIQKLGFSYTLQLITALRKWRGNGYIPDTETRLDP